MALSKEEMIIEGLYKKIYNHYEDFQFGSNDLRLNLISVIQKLDLKFSDKAFMILLRDESSVHEYSAGKALIFSDNFLLEVNNLEKRYSFIEDLKLEEMDIISDSKTYFDPKEVVMKISGKEFSFTNENKYGRIDLINIVKLFRYCLG